MVDRAQLSFYSWANLSSIHCCSTVIIWNMQKTVNWPTIANTKHIHQSLATLADPEIYTYSKFLFNIDFLTNSIVFFIRSFHHQIIYSFYASCVFYAPSF